MKKINLIVTLAILLLSVNNSDAFESHKIESGSNHFADLQIYSEGESFVYNTLIPSEVTTPVASFTLGQKNSIIQATKMWADTINLDSSIDNNYATYATFIYDDSDSPNAAASTFFVPVPDETIMMTEVNAVLLNKTFIPSPSIADGEIQIGATLMGSSVNYVKPTPLHHGSSGDLTSFMYHELAHTLGINSVTNVYNGIIGYPKQFPEVISKWDECLRVYNTEKSAEGMEIAAGPNVIIGTQPDNGYDFDLTKYAPYFAGDKTIKVIGNDTDYDTAYNNIKNNINAYGHGLINYSTNYDAGKELSSANRTCYGLPILPGGDITGNGEVELAHIELRNSLMSHQYYRNWKTLMEAEFAAMVDIGYDIDLKNFFGKSYYLNNITNNNTTGYFKSNGDGTYDTTKPNEADYGIGVHIYGDNNKITQESNILSKGAGSVGARIEGIENTYTLASGYTIDMTGSDSIGLAATWGKEHKININANSSVKSTGADGIAISFDFGDNILGSIYETQGSYIYNHVGTDLDPSIKELDGALAKELNIEGVVEGTKASVYMSHNAYVENINIQNGATIKGDIISEWNSKQSFDNVLVQTGGEIKYTNLNFNNYNKDFEDSITGSSLNNTLKMNVIGNLGLKNADISVYSLDNIGNIDIKDVTTISLQDTNKTITGSGKINITDNSFLGLNSNVQTIENTIDLNHNSYLSLVNNTITNTYLSNGFNVKDNSNLLVDFDFKNTSIDTISTSLPTVFTGDSKLTVMTNVFNSNFALTENNIEIPFINEELQNTDLLNHIQYSSQKITSPIYKYTLDYNENNTIGRFILSHGENGAYETYNPAVLASSVAAQGAFLTQINTYDQAFTGMDMLMNLSQEERTAYKYANRYAGVNNGIMTFSPNQVPEENAGLWFRPFASFEKVNLAHGPETENNTYGMMFGGDSGIIELSHGWDMTWGAYAGYTGSHQNYDGVSIYQNGGTLGLNAAWYKGNFFTGLTANVGASVAEADTMYGNENFTMLMTGIASKTGYNWEVFNSKLIIQPSLLLSYSFINTFDYTNAAGVDIGSSPLNAIQIVPGIKFIGNLPHGWQPYLNVQMVWNIMDETKFYANDVHLPQMSVEPYIQYGVGLQKRWGDRFTGFGQVMFRNGGRTGVALNAGFRWAIGKEYSKESKAHSDIPTRETKINLSKKK